MHIKIKLFIRNIVFSAVIISLFFLLSEIVVRVLYYKKYNDETYLFWGRTDIELVLRKNTLGAFQSNDNKYKIAVFGGSTVYGQYVPRRYAWSQLLEQLFDEEVTVINCGVKGSNSTADVDRMKSFLVNNLPDMIIFYNGVNDRAKLYGVRVGNDYRLQSELETTFIQRLDAQFMRQSLFYTAVKEKYNSMIGDINRSYQKEGISTPHNLIYLENAELEIFRKNLTEAAKLCKKNEYQICFSNRTA